MVATRSEIQNLKEKTRDFLHEKVAKEAELKEERPPTEKVKDAIPRNTHEIAEQIDGAIDNVKSKFNERLDEGTERERKRMEENKPNPIQEKVENIRSTVYDKTKPSDVKEREEYQEAPLTEKLKKMGEHGKKDREDVDQATFLG